MVRARRTIGKKDPLAAAMLRYQIVKGVNLGVEKDKTPTFRRLAQRFIETFGDKDEFPKLLAEFFEFGDKSLPFIVVSTRDNDVRSFTCESRKIREDVSD